MRFYEVNSAKSLTKFISVCQRLQVVKCLDMWFPLFNFFAKRFISIYDGLSSVEEEKKRDKLESRPVAPFN